MLGVASVALMSHNHNIKIVVIYPSITEGQQKRIDLEIQEAVSLASSVRS